MLEKIVTLVLLNLLGFFSTAPAAFLLYVSGYWWLAAILVIAGLIFMNAVWYSGHYGFFPWPKT